MLPSPAQVATRLLLPLFLCLIPLQAQALGNAQARALAAAADGGDTAALDKLLAAARAGDPNAENWYGIYCVDEGKDYGLAANWFRKAAEHGNAAAQYSLGVLYTDGLGVAADPHRAVAWYQRSAAQGYAKAENNLAWFYANGKGVARDPGLAASWYRKAAEQGNAKAQMSLGLLYASGSGVAKDLALARQWLQRSAAQGDPDAARELAALGGTAAATPVPSVHPAPTAQASAQAGTRPAHPAAARAAAPGVQAGAAGTSAAQAAAPGVQAGAAGTSAAQAAVGQALQGWARAWAAKDLNAYFAAYAPDYAPGMTHAAWMADRRARIVDKASIQVGISALAVRVAGDHADARFVEHYQAGTIDFTGVKHVQLQRIGGRWLIVRES